MEKKDMRKPIHLCILHPNPQRYAASLSLDALEDEFHFVHTQTNPDYVIATELIYYNKSLFKQFLNLKTNSAVLIFAADECIASDMNIFDYALTFDDNLNYDDRIIRRLYPFSLSGIFESSTPEDFDTPKEMDAQAVLKSKKHFCNFIYSNSNAHPARDELFYQLCKYRTVDSLGAHLNNKRNVVTKNETDWKKLSMELKQDYKFSVAAENACYKGYFSEKIITSYQATTIPIYWGCPNIAEYFNPDSFVNCHNYRNLDEVIDTVRQIDENDDLCCKMISAPRRTQSQILKHQAHLEKYRKFLINLFSQDKSTAKRTGVGTHPNMYFSRWSRAYRISFFLNIEILRKGRLFSKKLIKNPREGLLYARVNGKTYFKNLIKTFSQKFIAQK